MLRAHFNKLNKEYIRKVQNIMNLKFLSKIICKTALPILACLGLMSSGMTLPPLLVGVGAVAVGVNSLIGVGITIHNLFFHFYLRSQMARSARMMI